MHVLRYSLGLYINNKTAVLVAHRLIRNFAWHTTDFLSGDFVGRENRPILSFVWHSGSGANNKMPQESSGV